MEKKNIKIIGSGWGCAAFLKEIDNKKYNVSVISNNPNFLYTPLLANNTTNDIPLEQNITKINNNINYINDTVNDIDFVEKKIITKNNKDLEYDYLILCHGAQVNTFNIEGVNTYSYFLKDTDDAGKIKEKLSTLKKDSNIAVIGCGPTGTELIGNLIDLNKFNIYAVDGLKVPLSMFSQKISDYTIDVWKNKNIHLYFDRFVQKIDKNNIYFKNDKINYDMAIWCGGLKPNILTNKINTSLHNECRFGIPVSPTLNLIYSKPKPTYFSFLYNFIFEKKKDPDLSKVFAIGDCAYSKNPPTAQVASQQGKYLAYRFNKNFKNNIPFRLESKGQICYIGDKKSVYQISKFTSNGNITYYLNKIIHIYNAINFDQSKTFISSFIKNNN